MDDAPGSLIDRVSAAITAHHLFGPGERILVAVSGGIDSMVLLHLLHRLAPSHNWRLRVAHFNHRLRGSESDADEELVRKTARSLRIPFARGDGPVKSEARKNGWSVEMAARRLRHAFLANAAHRAKCSVIALAQHRDDQVELFFLRLLRGAGGEGLAGMKWRSRSPEDRTVSLARPFLDCPKDALRRYAEANGIHYSEDATNACFDMMRNRIRHRLLPLLRNEFQPALEQTILRAMEIIGSENAAVRASAEKWHTESQPPFSVLPTAVQRIALQTQLIQLGVSGDFDLIERLRLAADTPLALGSGKYILRNAVGLLQLQNGADDAFLPGEKVLVLKEPSGSTTFAGLTFAWEFAAAKGAEYSVALNTEQFDADKVGNRIVLRHWRPGDRFQPIGASSARKLQDLFTNVKVPKAERRRKVIAITASGDIFWVQAVRIGEKYKLRRQTRRRLLWRWREKPL